MKVLSSETKIQICLGEQGAANLNAHILITVPGYLKNKLTGRKIDLDLSALQAVVYDEADELFMQHNNHSCFEALKKHLKDKGVNPQHCMYSPTYNDEVVNKTNQFVGKFTSFNIKKESLKLKGVKNFKLTMAEQDKV